MLITNSYAYFNYAFLLYIFIRVKSPYTHRKLWWCFWKPLMISNILFFHLFLYFLSIIFQIFYFGFGMFSSLYFICVSLYRIIKSSLKQFCDEKEIAYNHLQNRTKKKSYLAFSMIVSSPHPFRSLCIIPSPLF